MIPVDQTSFGRPNGNCLQAALASLLELPLDQVPHVVAHDDWQDRLIAWAHQRGWQLLWIPAATEPPPAGLHLGCGPAPRGLPHSVVMRAGQLVWDPHPDRTGLDRVDWWLAVAPLDPARARRHYLPRRAAIPDPTAAGWLAHLAGLVAEVYVRLVEQEDAAAHGRRIITEAVMAQRLADPTPARVVQRRDEAGRYLAPAIADAEVARLRRLRDGMLDRLRKEAGRLERQLGLPPRSPVVDPPHDPMSGSSVPARQETG